MQVVERGIHRPNDSTFSRYGAKVLGWPGEGSRAGEHRIGFAEPLELSSILQKLQRYTSTTARPRFRISP